MPHLKAFNQFDGLGWSVGYLRNALAYQGVYAPHTGQPLSEALLQGITGGVCAGYFSFEYEGWDPHLHFLTRYPFNEEPGAVFERLAIPMEIQQTTNPQKAAANVVNALAVGKPAIVWADVTTLYGAPLDPNIWLVNPVIVYGCDAAKGDVHISDRARVPLATTTGALEAARGRIGKIKNRMMTIGAPQLDRLPEAVRGGMRATVEIMLEIPPFGGKSAKPNFGLDAFAKWADLLTNPKDKTGWPKRFAPGRRMFAGLTSAYRYLEAYYTGGRGARGLYADFLDEAALILGDAAYREVAAHYRRCAERWDALTAALLPDEVPLFREARELIRDEYRLFVEQGNESRAARDAAKTRLDALTAQSAADFPWDEAEAAAHRERLRGLVLALGEAERDAVYALKDRLG